jgi:hypothetical protein
LRTPRSRSATTVTPSVPLRIGPRWRGGSGLLGQLQEDRLEVGVLAADSAAQLGHAAIAATTFPGA